jgi:hypothetical protein
MPSLPAKPDRADRRPVVVGDARRVAAGARPSHARNVLPSQPLPTRSRGDDAGTLLLEDSTVDDEINAGDACHASGQQPLEPAAARRRVGGLSQWRFFASARAGSFPPVASTHAGGGATTYAMVDARACPQWVASGRCLTTWGSPCLTSPRLSASTAPCSPCSASSRATRTPSWSSGRSGASARRIASTQLPAACTSASVRRTARPSTPLAGRRRVPERRRARAARGLRARLLRRLLARPGWQQRRGGPYRS